MFFKSTVLAIYSLFLFGCATAKKDYAYMGESEYQSKPTLTQSLLTNDVLSEESIQKILSSKISIPKLVNIAVIRINDQNFQTIDEQLSEQFYQKSNWGNRAKALIPIPQILVKTPISISGLRQSAVLLQADILVIVKPATYSNWKFRWLAENKAKSITTLEVLVLDTRTGIIPFTSIITDQVEMTKDKNVDYDNYELELRVKKESEKKALIQVASQVKDFLNTIP
jgi:hypothetical protein